MKIHSDLKCRCLILLIAALVAIAPAQAQKMSQAAIIGEAQKTLQALKNVRGDFVQIDPNNTKASGRFYLRRPGKFRFEYTRNNPILIVSDGITLAIQNRQLKTFDRIPLAITPLSLFLGKTIHLAQPGLVRRVQSSKNHHSITLIDPKNKIEGSLTLVFSASDFKLIGWSIQDGSGRHTHVRLKDVKNPAKNAASLFRIDDPEDKDDRDR